MVGGEPAKRVRPFKEMRYKNNLLFLYRMTQKGKGFAKQNLYSRQAFLDSVVIIIQYIALDTGR